jgi:hypothetical protein
MPYTDDVMSGRPGLAHDGLGVQMGTANLAPKTQEAEKFPPKALWVLAGRTDDQSHRNLAAVITGPETAAYRVINAAERNSGFGDLIEVPTLLAELGSQAAGVQGGSPAQIEAMLIHQATALQSLFARLLERGMTVEMLPGFEMNMRVALRAQP